MERRLGEIDDVIDDDVAARGGQGANVIGETLNAVEGGGEEELRAGRHVVDDLEHRRALAAPRYAALSRQYRHVRRQIAGGYRLRPEVYAGGANADLDPCSTDAEEIAGRRHVVSHIAL